MSNSNKQPTPLLFVVLAFTIVYLVWGSTYFFIRIAVKEFPPFILGALRFIIAGMIMAAWCAIQGKNIFAAKGIKHAAIGGIILLFCGNGIIIWVEQSMPSAMVAIMVSSSPLWFVLLDKPKWEENLKSKSILSGMFIGLAGVILLFSEQVSKALALQGAGSVKLSSMALLVLAAITWSGGSLYSKYKSTEDPIIVTSAWQMIVAGIAFIPGVIINKELDGFYWNQVSMDAWLSAFYLIIFGSIAGFSAYIWLLKERPAMQVSTYAYVNPVVAVLLGVFFANENISSIQAIGLIIILGSVFMINMTKYRKEKHAKKKLAEA